MPTKTVPPAALEAAAAILAGLSVIVGFLALIVLVAPMKRARAMRPAAKWVGILSIAAFFLAVVAVSPSIKAPPVAKASDDPAPKAPAQPKAVARSQATIEGYQEPVLSIVVDVGGSGMRLGTRMEEAGSQIVRAGKQIAAGELNAPGGARIEIVRFTFLGPASDDQTVGRKFLHATYRIEDLNRVAAEDASPDEALNAAGNGGTLTPVNDDIVRDFCLKHQRSSWCERGNEGSQRSKASSFGARQ